MGFDNTLLTQTLGNNFKSIMVSGITISRIKFSNWGDVLFFTIVSNGMVHGTIYFVVVSSSCDLLPDSWYQVLLYPE